VQAPATGQSKFGGDFQQRALLEQQLSCMLLAKKLQEFAWG
jgi:hypothetical protein